MPAPNAGFVTIAAGRYQSLAIIGYPRGDMNCDRRVDRRDIDPFVAALASPDYYSSIFPNCYIANGDINADGLVNLGDINPFIALLTNP